MMILAQFWRPSWVLAAGLLVLVSGSSPGLAGEDPDPSPDEILALDLEDLLSIEVTSVSKRAQPRKDAAAAIYVITADDITRSGATTIPDALRMVPGLHVARIDGSKWAVTSRGFNSRFSNKLLVLVDGRSVYTTLFSGVYWEIQDLILEDIARIEIIRGPGSTLWGANAVNGVINIITKHAADTQGGYLTTVFGNEERGIGGFRYGTDLGRGAYVRGYVKGLVRDGFVHSDGTEAHDGMTMIRGGFRADYQHDARTAITLQGDAYDGAIEQEVTLHDVRAPYSRLIRDDATTSGWNLLSRMTHTISPTSSLTLHGYYSHDHRHEAFECETTDQIDFDLQHGFSVGDHALVWGGGYRRTRDELGGLVNGDVPEAVGRYDLFSAFLQDQFPLLSDRLAMTVGAKFEHNDYTGYEVQPSARLLWRAHADHRVWGAVSRAVRTPSRMEREISLLTQVFEPTAVMPLPVAIILRGGDWFGTESVTAYEAGYRFKRDDLSLDVSLFVNEYADLRIGDVPVRSIEPTHVEMVADVVTVNDDRSYGGELAAAWSPTPQWRWDLAYSYYHREYPPSATGEPVTNESGPAHQVSLRSSLQVRAGTTLDLWLRYVDECRTLVRLDGGIPAYTTLDARVGVSLGGGVTLSLAGQNLFDAHRLEYSAEAFTSYTEIERSYYIGLNWRF